jgi:hypothetical protein
MSEGRIRLGTFLAKSATPMQASLTSGGLTVKLARLNL